MLICWLLSGCVRLSGDLIYLDVVTLEGNKYCVTGATKAFYVNSSTGDILDPRPNKAALEATSLVGLLQKISPKFKKGKKIWLLLLLTRLIFWVSRLKTILIVSVSLCLLVFLAFREILERKASAHPFENVQSLLPPNSWLGLYPVPGIANSLCGLMFLGHS